MGSLQVQPDDGKSRHYYTARALREHGIEPHYVVEGSLTSEGYKLILTNPETGKPKHGEDDDFVIEFRKWPSKAVWEDVLEGIRHDMLRRYNG